MGVSLHVGDEYTEIGAASFLHAFFSTISVNLEPNGWGSRYPVLMNGLYQGTLPASLAGAAMRELDDIHRRLSKLPIDRVVWDAEDRSARPPWGDNVHPSVTSLGNYFVTSDGQDLFAQLRRVFATQKRTALPATIM